MAAAVSVYGLVADPANGERDARRLFSVLPPDARQLLVSQLTRIADAPPATLGTSFLIATVLALWSASKGVGHLFDAIGIAHGASPRGAVRRRLIAGGAVRRRLIAVVYTTVGLVVATIAVAAVAVLPSRVHGETGRWLVRLALINSAKRLW